MEGIIQSLIENSIVLATMAFAWSLAERRAKLERARVSEISDGYIEYLKQSK